MRVHAALQNDRIPTATLSRFWGWPGVFIGLLTLPFLILTLVPGSLEGKSLAVLHGLCAQQPTHSLYFAQNRLPFGSRMTGIYGGFALAAIFLALRGRWRAGGPPRAGIMLLMAGFVVSMGFDGLNSTLDDMGVWHLYPPHNAARLATGMLTGIAMATFVWMLNGQVAFRPTAGSRRPVWNSYLELGGLLCIEALFGAIILSRWTPLRLPLTYLLMLSAVGLLAGFMLALVLLVKRQEQQALSAWDLAQPACVALLAAFTVMALTGGGRFILEAAFSIQTTAAGG